MKYWALTAAVAIGFPALAWADAHTTGVPSLNSNPGAAYTIYLDFAGFNFTGGWGGDTGGKPGTMVSFNSASATSTFSSTEQSYIKAVFARAAEKYVGLNVNVTTIDPAVAAGQSSTDFARQAYYDSQARMMHTVITSTKQADNGFVAGGGVSFIGTTQYGYSSAGINGGAGRGYHTNWDFTDQLANQNSGTVSAGSLKYIGECAGHENGHGLSLSHQSAYNGATQTAEYGSNGDSTAIAPIMGISYGSARGTWRRGPTNSVTNIQNDITTLTNNSGMGGYRDDTIGHSFAAATPLNLTTSGTLVGGTNGGWIAPLNTSTGYQPIGEDNYTRDYYAFTTTGGALYLTINEANDLINSGFADPGGMLDSVIRLYDTRGNLISSVTNPTSQASSLSLNLAAGSYYLQIASAGGKTATASSTSNENATYYDMGSYFLTGTVTVPEPTSALAAVIVVSVLGRRRRVA